MKSIGILMGVPVLAAGMLGMAGCASVFIDVTQSVRVDAVTPSGQSIEGAACVAFNDRGMAAFQSGGAQLVRRSASSLHVTCTHPGQPPALGIATSRGNAGLAGNLVIGGLVGAAVDHSRGTAYTYPEWIRVEFGKALLFDRHLEKAGQPVVGYAAGSPPPPDPSNSATSLGCMQQVGGLRC
jgi:hypothetical protein